MFYIMLFISMNDGLAKMPGSQSLESILMLGSIVIAIFSVILLLYTNSFLIKRRKKEFGLFNILGMEKKHIARVMAIENLYTAVISIFSGLLLGILFSKLMFLLLMKLLQFGVPFGFEISVPAAAITALLFSCIFILTLVCNLMQVHLSKPVELLRGSNTGEKEPKTKAVLASVGFITLSAGYLTANIADNPLAALNVFFIAVILVITGTYCLFTAGSIALLKMLRANKSYYYKTGHFTMVSGMLYRMKQNAAGLANICILSTMVLVMLSGTISLYFGMEDALRNRFPRNIEIDAYGVTAGKRDLIDEKTGSIISASGIGIKNMVKYRYNGYTFRQAGSLFSFDRPGTGMISVNTYVYFIPVDDYNRLQNTSETLSSDELLLYTPNTDYPFDNVSFDGLEYKIKTKLTLLNVEGNNSVLFTDLYYFIIPDEQTAEKIYNAVSGNKYDQAGMSYYCGFDVDGGAEKQKALADALCVLPQELDSEETWIHVAAAEYHKSEFLSVYGGLFFLGIFLGALFIMAAVLIMYYKQISEGYDDKNRFEIMQKVGMSRGEVKETIRAQVLIVFFAPLAAAGIHVAAAFRMLTRLLSVLNLTNTALFAWCTAGTILVFALLYSAVYLLTARVYYKIVQ